MSMSYEIDHEAECLVVRSEGPSLDDDALVALVAQLRREAADAKKYNAIYDYRSIRDAGALTAERIRALADDEGCGTPEEPESKRVAIVTESDALYGLSRMFQTLSDGRLPEVRVFRDITAARAYVGRELAG